MEPKKQLPWKVQVDHIEFHTPVFRLYADAHSEGFSSGPTGMGRRDLGPMSVPEDFYRPGSSLRRWLTRARHGWRKLRL